MIFCICKIYTLYDLITQCPTHPPRPNEPTPLQCLCSLLFTPTPWLFYLCEMRIISLSIYHSIFHSSKISFLGHQAVNLTLVLRPQATRIVVGTVLGHQ